MARRSADRDAAIGPLDSAKPVHPLGIEILLVRFEAVINPGDDHAAVTVADVALILLIVDRGADRVVLAVSLDQVAPAGRAQRPESTKIRIAIITFNFILIPP